MSKRVGLRHMGAIAGKKKEIVPPAWNYDNVFGSIWLQGNPSGYDLSHQGQIEVREPSGTGALGETQGGYYDNR